jgi:hypothetical protein
LERFYLLGREITKKDYDELSEIFLDVCSALRLANNYGYSKFSRICSSLVEIKEIDF